MDRRRCRDILQLFTVATDEGSRGQVMFLLASCKKASVLHRDSLIRRGQIQITWCPTLPDPDLDLDQTQALSIGRIVPKPAPTPSIYLRARLVRTHHP